MEATLREVWVYPLTSMIFGLDVPDPHWLRARFKIPSTHDGATRDASMREPA